MSAPLSRLQLLAERWPDARWRVLAKRKWWVVAFMWVPKEHRR
jgi:hypothetical protein